MILFKEELLQLFEEAKACSQSVNLSTKKYECYVFKGVQIVRDETSIKIYSPKGMDFYDELAEDFYLLFMNGWKTGVYRLTLKKYEMSLEKIEKLISTEMNSSTVSLKVIEALRNRRLNIMNKFYTTRNKLNQQLL